TGNFYSSGSATLACGYITSSTSGSFGAVRIYGDSSASTLISLDGEYTGDQAGRSLDLEHDFDGDGIHDALVGAPYANSAGADAGKVYVVLGPVTGNFLLSGADMSIIGQGVDSHLGMQVGGGDISGDGRDDFFMTVESYDYGSRTNAGGVFVFDAVGSGPTIFAAAGLEIYGDSANDYLGGACAPSLGDVDGDGNLDILVSTPYDTGGGTGAGGAWLIYGPATGGWDLSLNYDARWLGDGTDYQVGAQAKIVGDTDGDGTADIALTGPNADERGYSNYGAMWLFLGN
ncbi:MAG TPA: integrin alpha, partial [Myxococcota bacterium]|nr:integrin alpha [Myxococcota bacterium]